MGKYIYKARNIRQKNSLGWSIILILIIVLAILLSCLYFGNNKLNYKKYKIYESKIDKEFNEIINTIDADDKRYNANELSKRQIIEKYKKSSIKLEKLYDSFKWKKGDGAVKQLYTIKKYIIISYSQLYYNKAVALENNIASNETEEIEYINILTENYKKKDKTQKQIYNLY
ncbi:hypothetical protein SAMN05428976_106104 [Clostridium sp. USBA 49]|uniref:hypothetical protein n=1 Tax=Clostridium TaxID=1485 RepID=UPI0009996130|nr:MULTISPECIES: hypothetical protein [Clostridium]SKA84009.1 hypothetical protein SAMN05428976_106104 [Clostridium sp. USBA 49]